MHWLHTQMALLDSARAVVSFAANWLLQSTLLIAAGLAVARWLGRRGSALQSAIYRTTLAAVIVCPLATALLARGGVSGWSVELPVAWTYEEKAPLLANDDARQTVASSSSTAAENASPLEPLPLSTSPAPNTAFGPARHSLWSDGVPACRSALPGPANGKRHSLARRRARQERRFHVAARSPAARHGRRGGQRCSGGRRRGAV